MHRAGRTGRAGRSGTVITFFTKHELSSVRNFFKKEKKNSHPHHPFKKIENNDDISTQLTLNRMKDLTMFLSFPNFFQLSTINQSKLY